MQKLLIALSIWVFVMPILPSSGKTPRAGDEHPPLQDTVYKMKSKVPIMNPERGYHLESNYFVHNLKNPFHPYTYPQGWIDDLNIKFDSHADKLSVLQLYLYLTDYVGKDIPQDAFEKMQMLFDAVKKEGYKVVLRFAYDNDYGSTKADFNDVFRHLNQLEPLIKKNIGLIDIWQMGFIGAWGEGHSSPMSNDDVQKAKMAQRILDIFTERQTTIRYPDQKNRLNLPDAYLHRMGYNNDYFTASEHPKAPGNDYIFDSPEYEQVKKESPYVQVIGEIPYAEATEWGLHSIISIPNTLKIFRDHHYSLFDITQNNELNIKHWKDQSLNPQMLESLGILFDESYFMEDGKLCGRSVYDFIRDHLGYRLYLDSSATKLSVQGSSLEYDIAIKNVGFSTIHNPRPLYMVLIDEQGKKTYQQKLVEDPRQWQPYAAEAAGYTPLTHHVKGTIPLGIRGKIKVGLWLPDPAATLTYLPEYAIQFANDGMEIWKDESNYFKVNIVGEISL